MANQVKGGVVLSYVAIFIHIITGFIYTPFVLRILGQSEYGLYSLANSTIATLTFLDLGMGNAVVRYTAKLRAEQKTNELQEMFGMFVVLYSIIGIIALMAGSLLAWNAEGLFSHAMTGEEVAKAKIMLWLLTFNLAFSFPMGIWGSIITAHERFIFLRVVSIIRSLVNPIIVVALLLIGYKAIAMVVVGTLLNVVSLSVNSYYCRHKLGIKVIYGKFNFPFLKEVFLYSFWILLNILTNKFYWSTGQMILGMTKGTKDVAIYSVAINLKSMFYMFSTSISGVLLPRITSMVAKGVSDSEISHLFIKTGRIQYAIVSLILVGFILIGRPFIILWAGPDYEPAYMITLLFFISTSIPLIQNVSISILQARNQMGFRCMMVFVVSALSLIVAFPVSLKYGSIGCAVVFSVAIIIAYLFILNVYYHRVIKLDIPLFWANIIRMSFPAVVILAGGLIGLQYYQVSTWAHLFVAVAIIFVSYLLLSYWTAFNDYEKNLFMMPLRKIKSRIGL